MIHTWRQIESVFRLYGNDPNNDVYWMGQRYFDQDNSDTYHEIYKSALDALNVPYSKKCLLSYMEKFQNYPEYKCLVSVAWQATTIVKQTMATFRHSPYTEFINYLILRRSDSGVIKRVKKKEGDELKSMACPIQYKGSSLFFSKVLGAAIVLIFGMCLS